MTSKKQKREAGVLKAAEEAAKLKQLGLEAQLRDKQDRAERSAKISEIAKSINDRYHAVIDQAIIDGRLTSEQMRQLS